MVSPKVRLMPDGPHTTNNKKFILNNKEDPVTTARTSSSFNFKSIFDSTKFRRHKTMDVKKSSDKQNGITGNSQLRRRRRSSSSGDSDLVVLSVVLNKKQKENDEVAIAIERLRQNGVNCVFFTMNDIRNGSKKPELSEITEAFRLSSSQMSSSSGEEKGQSKTLLSSQLPLPSIKCEVSENSNESTDSSASSLAIHQSVEQVINSFSPSPSPPPLSPQTQSAGATSSSKPPALKSMSSLLSPLLESKPPTLFNEAETTKDNKNKQQQQQQNSPESQQAQSQVGSSSSANNNNNSKRRRRRVRKPYTHRKGHLKKKIKERCKAAKDARRASKMQKEDQSADNSQQSSFSSDEDDSTSMTSSSNDNNNATRATTVQDSIADIVKRRTGPSPAFPNSFQRFTTTPTTTRAMSTTSETDVTTTTTTFPKNLATFVDNKITSATPINCATSKNNNKRLVFERSSSISEPDSSEVNCEANVSSSTSSQCNNKRKNSNNKNSSKSKHKKLKYDKEPTNEIHLESKQQQQQSPPVISQKTLSTEFIVKNGVHLLNGVTLPNGLHVVSSNGVTLQNGGVIFPDSVKCVGASEKNGPHTNGIHTADSKLKTNIFDGNPTTTTTTTTTTYNKRSTKSKKARKALKGKSKKVKSKHIKVKIDLPPPKSSKLGIIKKISSDPEDSPESALAPLTLVLQKTRAFSPDITYQINRIPPSSNHNSNKLQRQNSGNNKSIDNMVVTSTNGKPNNSVGQQSSSTTNDNNKVPNCVQIETISKGIDVQDVQIKGQHQQPNGLMVKEAPNNDGSLKQKVSKPKRKKKRGTRTRLAMRKSKKSRKSSVKSKPSNVIEGRIVGENLNEVENHAEAKSVTKVLISQFKLGPPTERPEKVGKETLQCSVSVTTATTHSSEGFNVVVKNEISTSSNVVIEDPGNNSSTALKNESTSIDGTSRVTDISLKSIILDPSQPSVPTEKESTVCGTVPIPGSIKCSEDSLPDAPDAMMQLRRSSFYSLVSGNVRTNLENYLDGRINSKSPNRRRKRVKNGFLLHHGDNCPEDPEAPYKLHLATQVLLKLNKRRAKFKPKEDRGKSLLSYLKLVPKRTPRTSGKPNPIPPAEEPKVEEAPEPLFSGEWTLERKFICGVCGQVEENFWDMVMHKGEQHPGVVVTHTELAGLPPSSLIRRYPAEQPTPSTAASMPPPCTKCSATFSTIPDLHRHIFECAGNAAWLDTDKVPRKRKRKGRRGFKRRLSNTPNKGKKPDANKRPPAEVFKCEFCSKSYKNQGWLKIHLGSHTLPVSIPLEKLSILPSRASFNSLSCQLFK